MKRNVLSTRTVESAKPPRGKKAVRLCDGMGLYLQLSQFGTKAWVYRYEFGGKTREMGLGSARAISLALARELAREQRAHLLRGDDPIEVRRAKQERAREQASERPLFRDAAERFIATHAPTWKNAKHRKQWHSTLATYAYPTLGKRPVTEIDGAAITEALSPIWLKKVETASRVKQRIERVVQWVKDGMPLPHQGVTKRVQHHKAMPFKELPDFMVELRKRNSISASALEVVILTALRTSEVIGATWGEIDSDAETWTVPASRMKAGRDHTVPLSPRVVEILKGLPRVSEYVFPGASKPHLSNMAMLKLLRGMTGNGYTVHGFRSAFRDWAGDQTHFPRDVIEHALAHLIKDKAEAAYRRSDALEKRRKLMQAWDRYLETPIVGATVTTLRRGA